jgi:hypothetical protein
MLNDPGAVDILLVKLVDGAASYFQTKRSTNRLFYLNRKNKDEQIT